MKIKQQDGPPSDLLYFDNEMNLTNDHVEDIVEIFNTPLTGAYNWDYSVADNRIKKLYELGKQLNWNGSIDLNWDYTHPADQKLVEVDEQLPHETLEAYEALTDEEKIEFDRHDAAELLSQFLHGEQGALLVASQLTSCAPTYNAKLYAASQTFDEARHVEVFNRYLQDKIGIHYPINKNLKMLLDKMRQFRIALQYSHCAPLAQQIWTMIAPRYANKPDTRICSTACIDFCISYEKGVFCIYPKLAPGL